MSTGELRGSAPVLTAKDVLLEVREDVKAMRGEVTILSSQNLDARVKILEAFMWRLAGLAGVGLLLGALAATVTLVRFIQGTP